MNNTIANVAAQLSARLTLSSAEDAVSVFSHIYDALTERYGASVGPGKDDKGRNVMSVKEMKQKRRNIVSQEDIEQRIRDSQK